MNNKKQEQFGCKQSFEMSESTQNPASSTQQSKHTIPVCCPMAQTGASPKVLSRGIPAASGGDQKVAAASKQRSLMNSADNDSEGATVLEGGVKSLSSKKPLSEWTPLDTKRAKSGSPKFWSVLDTKKGDAVSACNPQQIADLQQMVAQTKARAEACGEALSWDEFNGGALGTYNDEEQRTAQMANRGRVVELRQADFAAGTLRLRAGAYYRLTEDIEFDPNNAEVDWFERRFPTAAQRADGEIYSSDAFVRGFFAAIAVSAQDSWVLDLNGFEIKQSALFMARQRFSSVIELADQPFPVGQGPGMFGAELLVARNGAVANGRIGAASHHGIHANQSENILLENLEIYDYEVAALSLNGVKNFVITDCNFNGTNQNVVFNAKLSAANFVTGDARALLEISAAAGAGTSMEHAALEVALSEFEPILEPMLAAGAPGSPESPFANEECQLPDGSTARLIDGNAYGILVHSHGVAVNGFDAEAGEGSSGRPDSEDVTICNTTIANTFANVDEVATLFDTRTSKAVNDTSGAILDLARYFDCFNNRFDVSGAGDAKELLRLQIAVVQLRDYIATNFPETDLSLFAVGAIPSELFVLLQEPNTLSCENLPAELVWKRNGDSMFHVNKGAFGIRADGITNFCVRDVRIEKTANCGFRGTFCALPCEDIIGSAGDKCVLMPLEEPDGCCGPDLSGGFEEQFARLARSPYTSGLDGGHPMQGPLLGYGGADTYGVSVSAVTNFDLAKLEIEDVESYHGSAFGLVSQFETTSGKVTCSSVQNVRAATEACDVDFTQGIKTPVAQGVFVEESCSDIDFSKTSVSEVNAIGYAARKWCIDGSSVTLAV